MPKKLKKGKLNLSDISKPKKKDKSRTAQSIKTETDYLKQRQNKCHLNFLIVY